MARDAGQHVHPRVRMHIDAERARRLLDGLIRGERERRAAEFGRVETEHEVMHDRVADQRDLEDLLRLGARVARHIGGEFAERRAHSDGHLLRAARVHHGVRDPAHEVFAEADLRVHHAGRGHDLTGRKIAEVRGDGRRADIHRHAERALVEARPQADDLLATVHRRSDLPGAGAQRALQRAQHVEFDAEPGELPLALQRLEQATQVARRVVHVRLADLHIVQAHQRIEVDLAHLGSLAHHLTMHLARRRHIDHHIGADLRLAGEPLAGLQHLAARAARLDLTRRGDAGLARAHTVLGELALCDHHLTAAADAATAADRIDVDAELARRLQQRRAEREPPALARREEDHQCVSLAQDPFSSSPGFKPRRRHPRPQHGAAPRPHGGPGLPGCRPPPPAAAAHGTCGSSARSRGRDPS